MSMGYVKPNCHEKTGEFFWEPRMIHHNSPSHFPGFGDFPGHHIPTFPMTPYLQKSCLSHLLVAICHDNMEVAWNRGTPTSSIWGYPHLWKPQLVAYAFWIDTQDTVHNLQHEPHMNHTDHSPHNMKNISKRSLWSPEAGPAKNLSEP